MKNGKSCVRTLAAVSLLALIILPSFAVQEALITQDEACGGDATAILIESGNSYLTSAAWNYQ